MSSIYDTNLPITGICLVSKPNNVPTGYQCIRKAFDDTTRDADLMVDSLLERKDRFLCITRIFPLAGNKQYVVEDIKLINERDSPPPNYTPLAETVDTKAKGTVKKIICVKLVERQAGMKAICDIAFLYRQRRPPQFFTLIGEINGLQMCVKEGTVPPFRAPPPVPTNVPPTSSNLYSNATSNEPYYGSSQQYGVAVPTSTLTKKSDEKDILEGIPFSINPIYLSANTNNANNLSNIDSLRILSPYEVEQSFYYDFSLERSFAN